jgi:hypothetical protein
MEKHRLTRARRAADHEMGSVALKIKSHGRKSEAYEDLGRDYPGDNPGTAAARHGTRQERMNTPRRHRSERLGRDYAAIPGNRCRS